MGVWPTYVTSSGIRKGGCFIVYALNPQWVSVDSALLCLSLMLHIGKNNPSWLAFFLCTPSLYFQTVRRYKDALVSSPWRGVPVRGQPGPHRRRYRGESPPPSTSHRRRHCHPGHLLRKRTPSPYSFPFQHTRWSSEISEYLWTCSVQWEA